MVLCGQRKKEYPLKAEKPGLHQHFTYVRRDRGCRNPIPGNVSETRGFALSVPKAKKVLNACHALHTARIAPKPPATRARRSNCAHPTRRLGQRYEHEEMYPKKKKNTIIHIHMVETSGTQHWEFLFFSPRSYMQE